MDTELKATFEQWERQEEKRLAKVSQNAAYVELNNLYLAIERGYSKLTVWKSNQLRTLVSAAYDIDDQMRDWWMGEFLTLPNWANV
jgi:hypothetical protein